MKSNIIKLVGVQALLVFAALLFGGASANAAADTCVWTGGGTGTVDSGANTITFNVNDASNWSTCDNGAIPEAGDTLEFPANLADVDPGDTIDDNDEWQWTYIVNNDLAADTAFAAINFTGDAGDDNVNNDGYKLAGNAIQLNGDITLGYNTYNERPEIRLDVEALTDVALGVGFGSNSTLTYGANELTLGSNGYPSFSAEFNGTGVINIGQANFNLASTSSIGSSIVVQDDRRIYVDLNSPLNDSGLTITLGDGASMDISSSQADFDTLNTNIVFVGSGTTTSYSTSNNYSDPSSSVEVENYRGSISGSEYNPETEKTTLFGITLAGDMTLSSDTVLQLRSDAEITGDISGEYEISLMAGSVGRLAISSENNDSETSGTLSAEMITFNLFDEAFDIWLAAGRIGILSPDEEIDDKLTVIQGARLQGEGQVAGLEVQTGAVVAPGNSPGCIVSDGDLELNGTYEFEIEEDTECTGYDQLDVTGAVDITGATLEISLLDDYNFDVDTEFILINNDGSDDVTGEFDGLEEGDTITVDGNDFEISYEGGDGNDVSVLAISISDENAASEEAPGAPDTGVGSLMQNPMVTLLAAVLAAGAIVGLRKVQSSRN